MKYRNARSFYKREYLGRSFRRSLNDKTDSKDSDGMDGDTGDDDATDSDGTDSDSTDNKD